MIVKRLPCILATVPAAFSDRIVLMSAVSGARLFVDSCASF